ncbi:hypothetical protein Cfla_3648 [Cellulomonas flavigena DSM 20109]|uniref:Uncharacterized protein n=1 Tax=Cellulomonas flavigena (strain ATCC 482 / DSM 20109 / BCRC 11376 / JCM 18109 / NBRC 3775 / NCIMB 8073 / NRS 134) TaxID=446466 RepID=D5UE43_CELFN|nr:ATP-binding protein [Cellulomonas flavigena]ADG76519.1 hypothetical protein Cfla_3648 [Cellulomonas flavigena DSM 20109]
MPPFAVDGAVDEEKLHELLAVATELDELDYKATLDLSKGADRKHRVEFVKDVAALSSLPHGGYLVVGVNGKGQPAHDQPAIEPAHFDTATLTDIVTSEVDGRVTIRAAVHRIDDRDVALVYVGSTQDGYPVVCKKTGEYSLPSGKQCVVYRRGDTFTRGGTQSRRIEHRDWPAVLLNLRARARAEAATETQEVIARLAEQFRREPGEQPVVIDVAMSPEDFEAAVVDALERKQTAAVRRAVDSARVLVASAWTDVDRARDVQRGLDRLCSVAGVALGNDDLQLFEVVIKALYRVYKGALMMAHETYPSQAHPKEAALLWREIAARLLTILGAAVRAERWAFVRPLVLKSIGTTYSYATWLRHAVTEASRANLLVSQTGEPARGALVRFAREAVQGIPALCNDVDAVPFDFDEPPASHDELLDSICQGDFLWCVIVHAATTAADSTDGRQHFYPSCSGLYAHRTAPIAEVLATDEVARRDGVGQPDPIVARAIRTVDEAARVAEQSWDWTIRTDVVKRFLAANPGPST